VLRDESFVRGWIGRTRGNNCMISGVMYMEVSSIGVWLLVNLADGPKCCL
jgi:hypothetical protein